MASPLRRRRIGFGLIAGAALLAATATLIRDRVSSSSGWHSASYLLDAVGWLIAVGGAVLEITVGNLLLAAGQRSARRRAILMATLGLGIAGLACITIPGRPDEAAGPVSQAVRAGLAALLVAGIGIGLAGAGTLIAFFGGRYAADRVAQMGEEDW